MITLSTYSEPAPVTPISDLPQASPEMEEIEESNEPSQFAKLLAGLLAKSGFDEESAVVQDAGIQGAEIAADFNSGEFANLGNFREVSALEETGAEKTDFFGVTQKIEHIEDAGIPEEHFAVLLSAEHLLDRTEVLIEIENEADTGELPLAIAGTQGDFIDPEPIADFALPETAEIAAVQMPAALPGEDLHAETDNKKDRATQKTEGIQTRSSQAGTEISRGEDLAVLKNKTPEKEAPSRLDEARAKGRRDRVSFEVHDMRTGSEAEGSKAAQGRGLDMRINAGAEARVQGDAPAREITLELRLPEQAQTTAQTTWEAKAGNAMENMLARELHQNFNGDIVRHASMALRDGGEGTIRIALKPESLGNVKIRLEMAENKITGIIVVESEEALNAFRKEIASLEQAFRDSGFQNADLNLSLAADGRNAQGQEQTESSFTPRTAALRYEDSFENDAVAHVDVITGQKQGSINMLA